MSYVVTVKRIISKDDLLPIIQDYDGLNIVSEADGCLAIEVNNNTHPSEFIFLSQGEISANSPSDYCVEVLNKISSQLNAEVIGEEDAVYSSRTMSTNSTPLVTTTWLGWPIIVVVLFIMLVVKW